MPQLRDSGNHSSSPLDAGTLREVHSFARIFGIETEYGVSVTGADVPVSYTHLTLPTNSRV